MRRQEQEPTTTITGGPLALVVDEVNLDSLVEKGLTYFIIHSLSGDVEYEFYSVSVDMSKTVNAALKKGCVVEWPNGRKEFVTVEAILDTSRSGSEMYTWDKTSNRVRCNVTKVTMWPSGARTTVAMRPVYRNYDRWAAG